MVLQCICRGGESLTIFETTLPTSSLSAVPTFADVKSGAVIAVCFLGLIAVAEVWRAFRNPPAEWTRKLVHIGGGLICLTLPFFIQSHWVALVLAAGMAAIFIVSKHKGLLNSVHGVDRKTLGTEFYPVVIYLLFVLCLGVEWKFVICVLVLAVSDSAAALVGKRFGRLRFAVEEECKSVEGSAAFFAVTFAVVFVPLLIWNPLDQDPTAKWHYALASCLIGMLVMCVELVSLRGMDNLWVPLGTLLVLTKTMQTDVYDLSIQNVSFLAILTIVIVFSYVSRAFNVGGAIVVCLGSYSCWAMGSFDWALPVFVGFGFYLVASRIAKSPWKLRVRPVLISLLPPLLILAAANIFLNVDRVDGYRFLFVPFLTSVSMALTQGCSNLTGWIYRRKLPRRFAVTVGMAISISLILNLPAVFRGTIVAWPTLLLIAVVVLGVSMLSCYLVPPLPPGEAPRKWLYMRAAITTLAFVFMVLLELLGVCMTGVPA